MTQQQLWSRADFPGCSCCRHRGLLHCTTGHQRHCLAQHLRWQEFAGHPSLGQSMALCRALDILTGTVTSTVTAAKAPSCFGKHPSSASSGIATINKKNVLGTHRNVLHTTDLVGHQHSGSIKGLALQVCQLLHCHLPAGFCLTHNLHSTALTLSINQSLPVGLVGWCFTFLAIVNLYGKLHQVRCCNNQSSVCVLGTHLGGGGGGGGGSNIPHVKRVSGVTGSKPTVTD